MHRDKEDKKRPHEAFELCVDRYDCALRDIVRHLARISASQDYRDFQKDQKGDFIKGEQKELKP